MNYQPDYIFTYSETLTLHVFKPNYYAVENPVAIFFHGGGWTQGSPSQFYPLCHELVNKKITSISVSYHLNSSPAKALNDAKVAIHWIKQHSTLLNINPERLILGGGSVGGQLALLSLSEETRPKALILFNPIIDCSPNGFGYELFGETWQSFSPLHNLNNQLPPLIAFFGSNDQYIPISTIKNFEQQLKQLHIPHSIFIYENQQHSFFNYQNGNNPFYYKTLKETLSFLDKLGFLNDN